MFINRYYQDDAEKALFNYFKTNDGNPCLALPTGTGKSIIIANFIKKVFTNWPNQKVMMLTHVKELIEQNAEKLKAVWPLAPLGIYSAGLKCRHNALPITFGGIQSVSKAIKRAVKKHEPNPFGWQDLIVIDEAHLLNPSSESMYSYTIAALQEINPNLKVIGLTATPYRLKDGMLTDDKGLFTDICYDITDITGFNRLIEEGYIAPLIPKQPHIEIDTSNVKMCGGDYNLKSLQEAVDTDEITFEAVKEMCDEGADRKHWLVFASGIENAEHIASAINSFGIPAASCHSKLSDADNTARIEAFKDGSIRAIVNNNKLTTGFDFPSIDMIGMLRPTVSPGLWVQMLGRGTRPAEGKENCLVLDFAGNTKRLGPINDPVKPRKRGEKGEGTAPIKICDACGMYNHASVRVCALCGAKFSFKVNIFKTAATDQLIRSDAPVVEHFTVQKCVYNLHEKKNSSGVIVAPPSIKVSYYCGLRMFNEWICLEHNGLASKRSRDWWRQRHTEEPPATTHEALQKVSQLRVPKQIRVWVNKKYPEILGAEF